MTENINPEKTPPVTPDVPAGYDQPEAAPPSYQAPGSFEPPATPSYQQQGYQQGYQQPAYGMAGVGEQKSKVVAGILGILLGSLGIHNFYLGKTKIALIQLLASVISLGLLAPFIGIWGLIEGILILVGHESYRTDSRGIPLKD